MIRRRILSILLALLLIQCTTIDAVREFFITPDVKPIKETLIRGLPLGFASRVAQLTVEGNAPDFVTINSPCNNFPCTSVIQFRVGDTGFPWFATSDNTIITVAGLWTSPQQGLISVLFTSNQVGKLRLLEFKSFPVQEQFDGNLILAFSRIDINPGSGPLVTIDFSADEFNVEFDRFVSFTSLDSLINVTEEVWMMEVQDNGTNDLNDDVYSLTGAGQFVTVADENVIALQVAAINLEITPACATNPTRGDILINNAGTTANSVNVGMAYLEFEGNCDSKVRVNIATGSYVGSFGKNLTFDLTDFN